jgi:copper chaperone CopZ
MDVKAKQTALGLAVVVGLFATAGVAWKVRSLNAPGAAVQNASVTLDVTGMHCDGCAGGLTSELRRVPGVCTAEVSLTNRTAVVAYDTNRVGPVALLKVVSEAGFEGRVR